MVIRPYKHLASREPADFFYGILWPRNLPSYFLFDMGERFLVIDFRE